MDGIVVGADPVNWWMVGIAVRGGRHRVNDDMVVAATTTECVDAGEAGEHPFADRAEGVVGEGIHGCVLFAAETLFFRVAVPAFPNCGCALIHLIAPGWKLMALEKLDCEIVLAGGREGRQQHVGANKSSSHA